MSKKYVCDICNKVMDDPYEAHMREFYIGHGYENGHAYLTPIKTFKTKIDICGECFKKIKVKEEK